MDVLEGDCLVDCLKDPCSAPGKHLRESRYLGDVERQISETLSGITLEQLVTMNRDKLEKSVSPSI